MTKILKKVQLNTEQSTPKSADPTKGTQENPYSQEEFSGFPEGTWKGGYVEGAGYVAPATRGSYPDTGNVLYPGIYVDAGKFQADHEDVNNWSHDGIGTTVNVNWTSGYTGNANLYGDPDWFQSGINASINRSNSNQPRNVVLAHWKKISDGVYHAVVEEKPSEYSTHIISSYEYTMEELETGHKP